MKGNSVDPDQTSHSIYISYRDELVCFQLTWAEGSRGVIVNTPVSRRRLSVRPSTIPLNNIS